MATIIYTGLFFRGMRFISLIMLINNSIFYTLNINKCKTVSWTYARKLAAI